MTRTLVESDFAAAAHSLNCDVAAIKAVAEVEAAGDGFLPDGRIKVLFEGHVFYRETGGLWAESHPDICYKSWTKAHYAKGRTAQERGDGELARLGLAMALDRIAALRSASYGKFQIMGFNHALCGFDSVDSFFASMQISEREHLTAFVAFLKARKLDAALREARWADFAKGYNGPKYAENQYDVKLARAHAKHR